MKLERFAIQALLALGAILATTLNAQAQDTVTVTKDQLAAMLQKAKTDAGKLDINTATLSELRAVGFTPDEAARVIAKRGQDGPFASIRGLLRIMSVEHYEALKGKIIAHRPKK